MSDDVVIRVTDLGKRYKLGLVHHDRLADAITASVRWAGRGMRGLLGRKAQSAEHRITDPTLSPQPSALRSMQSPPGDSIWALRDVSLDVRRGEVLGIIGRNGAGKSTLLKILSRITEPTEGRAEIRGRVASLLEVGTGFHPELTGRENVFLNGAILGMTKAEIRSKLDEIVAFAEISEFMDTPVKRYSSGMYVRLAFAVAAHLEPEILLVDEVLAVGDISFQKRCLGKMDEVARGGRTVLFISHNMAAIRHLCPKAMLIDGGRIVQIDESAAVVEAYSRSFFDEAVDGAALPPGCLYKDEQAEYENGCRVTGVQMLDETGQPKEQLCTWEYVRFRITYEATKQILRGSVVLKVSTREAVPLSLCSTEPDHTHRMIIEPGQGHADCVFPQWPYAAGTYLIGAGLATPTVDYLWWRDAVCSLSVGDADVYQSGLPPAANRYLVAAEHRWEFPTEQAAAVRT